jgi:hypothetical protein
MSVDGIDRWREILRNLDLEVATPAGRSVASRRTKSVMSRIGHDDLSVIWREEAVKRAFWLEGCAGGCATR